MSRTTLTITPVIAAYLTHAGMRDHPVLSELRARMADFSEGHMQVSAEQGAFMQMLVKMSGARKGIEIGTFTGYSALATVLAMPDDGHLTCLDVSEEWTNIAREHWQKAGVSEKITLKIQPALDSLAQMQGQEGLFDWVFIDADKENYLNYYRRGVELLKSGGLVLVDNSLWGGSVVNPQDAETRAIDECNRFIQQDDRVDMVLLPVSDGLMIARKR
ncbi:O-methyltransferase [Endozoicomonas sp. 8E]|uniref:O-methyltransferase n=1 Tax=Endozoicomonas sp. 8E TaxID=3035692 RepID=UPI00293919C1|nr:class I SAM-dependent methyltransferase [Endozoicomonas sp. 8E]WOG27853.1 class I SAM-dependent methyltransferase [Endozoicomonas sp. 8E]